MPTIRVNLTQNAYEVLVGPGILSKLGSILRSVCPHERCALLADEKVFGFYGERARQSLSEADFSVLIGTQPSGESHKTLDTVRNYYDLMLNARLERRSPVISLGGGVNGDTAGFVAATYLRGVPFVQCPTTLLAMVDASVGGKVGVDMPQGKNLVGAFYQPKAVVIDPDVLRSLPLRELRCGLAECFKHAIIRDASLFEWLENKLELILQLETEALVELISRNVMIKARVVEADEREQGERAHLNFGHTFAHAIEATSGFGVIEHGEAVGLGMIAATSAAVELGKCHPEMLSSLVALLKRAGLPTKAELADDALLMDAMQSDKKVKDGLVHLVISEKLGSASVVTGVPAEVVSAGWRTIRSI